MGSLRALSAASTRRSSRCMIATARRRADCASAGLLITRLELRVDEANHIFVTFQRGRGPSSTHLDGAMWRRVAAQSRIKLKHQVLDERSNIRMREDGAGQQTQTKAQLEATTQ